MKRKHACPECKKAFTSSHGLKMHLIWKKKKAVTKEEGRKDDDQKLRWDLLPTKAVEEVVKVLTFGAKKYGSHNWKKVAEPERRYYAAAFRHLVAWNQGEKKDSDTGLSPLAHAACCILFLLDFERVL